MRITSLSRIAAALFLALAIAVTAKADPINFNFTPGGGPGNGLGFSFTIDSFGIEWLKDGPAKGTPSQEKASSPR